MSPAIEAMSLVSNEVKSSPQVVRTAPPSFTADQCNSRSNGCFKDQLVFDFHRLVPLGSLAYEPAGRRSLAATGGYIERRLNQQRKLKRESFY